MRVSSYAAVPSPGCALQLYVPVSNALGLGSSFRELEELGYKALFPQTYSNLALWHGDVSGGAPFRPVSNYCIVL